MVSLPLTMAPLRGPSLQISGEEVWWATRTPDGPATVVMRVTAGRVVAKGWGPGREHALARVAAMFDDDATGFVPRHAVIVEAHRRLPGLRIPRSGAVVEALMPAILEQKVVGKAARESWRRMVWRYSEPAPGPLDRRLWLPPDPARIAALPPHALHSLNVEGKRAGTMRTACAHASQLEANPARMTTLPGIGRWTYAQVALTALGDADAVPVGDFHLKNVVAWNLTGRPRGTDDEMLEVLEPYRGHRGRVVQLLKYFGDRPPRYGPRLSISDITAL
jgi:3-methyladenine DNA glycosylase/8-oxoguanine DNA glycosylase